MTFKTDDYPTEWKEIAGFDQKGLPKSALEKVVALHKKAMAENNPAQIVKTLIYRARYTTQMEEEGFVKAINTLENEEKTASFPTKSVLQSMLAEMYAGYLENNVWRFRNRTTTVNFRQEDIGTWDIERINNESARFYRLSLSDERIKQVPLKTFNAVTLANENGENTEGVKLRSTLFDFLAHRAFDFLLTKNRICRSPPTNLNWIRKTFFLKPRNSSI
ncbi:MAG: hypothetical protein HC817_11905 [Saprospiraceae bacterium]|nr:hypothetical protein [Saprospiraceae bacterium]